MGEIEILSFFSDFVAATAKFSQPTPVGLRLAEILTLPFTQPWPFQREADRHDRQIGPNKAASRTFPLAIAAR